MTLTIAEIVHFCDPKLPESDKNRRIDEQKSAYI